MIALFTLSTIFGVHSQYGDIVKTYVHGVGDIRLGIDIQGGVDVTFEPAGDADATEEWKEKIKDIMNYFQRKLSIILMIGTTK